MRTASVQELIDSVLMICGTPDQCYQQTVDFIEYTGGLGNLLVDESGDPCLIDPCLIMSRPLNRPISTRSWRFL